MRFLDDQDVVPAHGGILSGDRGPGLCAGSRPGPAHRRVDRGPERPPGIPPLRPDRGSGGGPPVADPVRPRRLAGSPIGRDECTERIEYFGKRHDSPMPGSAQDPGKVPRRHPVHRQGGDQRRHGDDGRRLAVDRIDLPEPVGAIGQVADQGPGPLGEAAGPAEDVGDQLALDLAEQAPRPALGGHRSGACSGRPRSSKIDRSTPSRSGTGSSALGREVPVVVLDRIVDRADVLVEVVGGDDRVAVGQLGHRPVAVLELRQGDRPLGVLGPPVEPGGHPDGEGLGPVLVGVLLGVPAGQVPDEPAAERLGPVLLGVGLGPSAPNGLDPLAGDSWSR